MCKNIIFILLLTGIFCATNAIAGPFGLEMGMSIEEIGGNPKELSSPLGIYQLKNVPKPHPAFERYIVRVSPNNGLFLIRALGKQISTNIYGINLKQEFEQTSKKLEKKYGACDKNNLLLPGSIWNKPEDFMMSLLKEERILMSLWHKKYNSKLPNDIYGITLKANAFDSNGAFLILEYTFKNFDSGSAELNAKQNDSL